MASKTPTHSIAGAAKILGIGRELCKRAVDQGQIPAIRIGKRCRISDDVIKRLLGRTGAQAALESAPDATRGRPA